MCLAIPARVIEIPDPEHAVVDMGGVRKLISTVLLDQVRASDYVIVHVGYALNRLDPEEAEETLQLFAEFAVADAQVANGASRRHEIPR